MSDYWMRWTWDADEDDFNYKVIDAVSRIQGYTGASYQYLRIDPSTFSLQMIDHIMHEVHEGNAFSASQKTLADAFDTGSPMTFYIITPDTTKWAHVVISGDANAPAYWELFEDTGNLAEFNVSGGNAYTPINRNRNSSTASALTITTGATVTVAAAAALLSVEGMMKSSDLAAQQGFILKQNTKYLIRATTYADDNEGTLRLKWHEFISME